LKEAAVHELMPFIVSGIATGSVYGLAGTGLVLTYKTSGIFNLGYGALATAAAYLFYWLNVVHGLPWGVSLAVAVLGGGLAMGLLMEVIARHIARQSTSMQIVATIGLVVLTQGLATIKFGPDPLTQAQWLPHGSDTFGVLGANVSYAQLTITLVAVVMVAGLYAVFRFARIGLAMRAVVDDPDLLATKGTPPARVRRVAWIVGSVFAALCGVLLAPLVGLEPIALTLLVVQAFGAAAVGRFTNIPATLVGGLVIGVIASLSTKYVLDAQWLSGLASSVPFIILFIALLVTPRRKLVRPTLLALRPRSTWRPPATVQLAGAVVALAVLGLVPTFAGTHLPFWTTALTRVILFLSLGLLIRTSGQVSLCQVAFAAIGTVAFSQFAVQLGMPWLVAVLVGALVAVPIGAVLAIPAIRLSGLFLALGTFGFGILVANMFYSRGFMFTLSSIGRKMPRPSVATSDTRYYYVVLAFTIACGAFLFAIHRVRLGRMLRGMSEAPTAVSMLGLSTNVTKVIVFCIASYMAGLAGILYGCSVTVASAGDAYYSSFTSLTLVAILALAPFAEPWYALVAGLTAVIPSYLTGADIPYWMNVIFGLLAVVIGVQGGTQPLPQRLRALVDRLPSPRRRRAPVPGVPAQAAPEQARPVVEQLGLEAADIVVRFGGLVAVNGVSLTAPLGRITGLIGPNGAGKTTLFNALSGLNRPASGGSTYRGRDISGLSPADRARRGMGRTFQMMQLGETMTVLDNVALGREAGLAGRHVLRQVVAGPGDDRAVQVAAYEALEACGILDLAEVPCGQLSTGQRRFVELARCIAGGFDLLLLDEPSSGLDLDETAAFAAVLRRLVAERGTGVLLVEHDMPLVMDLCDYLYVLDFGQLIFEGTPAEVAASQVVQAAYLGSSELDVPVATEVDA
jgi:ABC-type branched-subunit amino acid transport system ATPase component/branched-subunit amino acid ABC-type transport system permease component